jgi:glycosyltransferase involved in cell wall biosynthesis
MIDICGSTRLGSLALSGYNPADMDNDIQSSQRSKESSAKPVVGLNAHLLSRTLSYRSAGVSRYIQGLMTHLPLADHSFSYVAYTGDPALRVHGWQTRVSSWRTDRPSTRILWEQLAQPWTLRRDEVDLVHAPVYVGPLATRRPLVITIHDLSFFLYPELFPRGNRLYLQVGTRRSAQQAVSIIADSQSTRRDIQEILGVSRSRVEVIYPGVGPEMRPIDDAERLASLRARYSLPERFILCVATLEPRKNILVLLEAMALLGEQSDLPHRLVVAGGKGWFYETLEARVQALGLQDRVLFPGFVPDGELPIWYSAAELFVYPSRYEGFGLPPLEAMACGTPVIVSDQSSLPEVVGHAGVQLPPDDPALWAQTIAELLASPARLEAMREAGLERTRSFGWDATARATAELYRQVLHA